MSDHHESPWNELSLHFKLRYDLGYRYLDKCGELMLKLEQEFGYVPTETVPIGGKLEIPEEQIFVELDSTELRIRQENPSKDSTAMLNASKLLSRLVLEHFEPAIPSYSGYASQSYCMFGGEAQVYSASIVTDGDLHHSLAKELDVQARSQELHHNYNTGSYELQFILRPVAINTPQRQILSKGFHSSERSQKIIERRNKVIETSRPSQSGYALLLHVDLHENTPSLCDLESHFTLLKTYQKKLQNRYSKKP